MFDAIKDFSLQTVSSLLALFYSLPVVGGSYGVAIMLLTATVMIVLMPLTLKATRSTIKMTQLQPELRALQKEYKDDKQALNQAMMKLYSENGVNPVGGCLPMLAQLPVFLILFNVLRGLTRRVSEKPYFVISEEANRLVGGQTSASNTFDPEYLGKDTELYQDLTQATEMKFLGVFDLSLNPWDVVQSDFVASLPYVVLILFVVATSYFQQRQISARRGSVPDNPTPQQQTQQQLLKILPLMSGIWSFLFPAGLVLYWATSNVFRIGQQAYITRALYSDEPGTAVVSAESLIGEGKLSNGSGNGKSGKNTKSAADKDGSADRSNGRNSGGGQSGNGSKSTSKSKSKAGTGARGGTDSGGDSSVPVDRNEAWAKRRQQKAKSQQRKRTAGGGSTASNRTTPKGTKPTANRKKRKK